MVKINDDYFIENTDICYTAKIDKHKMVEDKNGKEMPVTEIIGYYSTLENAIKGVRADMIAKKMKKKTYSLDEAIKEVRMLNKEFNKLINMEG